MNVNERFPVTELQVMAYICGLIYAFRIIAGKCALSPEVFCTTYRFAVTRLWSHPPYFRWRS